MSDLNLYLKSFFGKDAYENFGGSWNFRLSINGIDNLKKLHFKFLGDRKGGQRIFENLPDSEIQRLVDDLRKKFAGEEYFENDDGGVQLEVFQPQNTVLPGVLPPLTLPSFSSSFAPNMTEPTGGIVPPLNLGQINYGEWRNEMLQPRVESFPNRDYLVAEEDQGEEWKERKILGVPTHTYDTIVQNVALFFYEHRLENKGYSAEDVRGWVGSAMKKSVLINTIRYSFRMIKQYGFLEFFQQGRLHIYRLCVYKNGVRKGQVTEEAMRALCLYLNIDENGEELDEFLGDGYVQMNQNYAIPDEIFSTNIANAANFFYTHRNNNTGYTRENVFDWMVNVVDRKTKVESVKWSLRKMRDIPQGDQFLEFHSIKGRRCRQNVYRLITYKEGPRMGFASAQAVENVLKFMKKERSRGIRVCQVLSNDMHVAPREVYVSGGANVANFFKTFADRWIDDGYTARTIALWIRKFCQPGIKGKTVENAIERLFDEGDILTVVSNCRYNLLSDENGEISVDALGKLEEFIAREENRVALKRKRDSNMTQTQAGLYMANIHMGLPPIPEQFVPRKRQKLNLIDVSVDERYIQ